jgi:hypothetical protein
MESPLTRQPAPGGCLARQNLAAKLPQRELTLTLLDRFARAAKDLLQNRGKRSFPERGFRLRPPSILPRGGNPWARGWHLLARGWRPLI